jgi:hypothetical protein
MGSTVKSLENGRHGSLLVPPHRRLLSQSVNLHDYCGVGREVGS